MMSVPVDPIDRIIYAHEINIQGAEQPIDRHTLDIILLKIPCDTNVTRLVLLNFRYSLILPA